jgi:hypothetical protein
MGILDAANKFLALTGLATKPSQQNVVMARPVVGPEQRSNYIDGQPIPGSQHYGFEHLDERRGSWLAGSAAYRRHVGLPEDDVPNVLGTER